ncbi:MAG: hypothetical protein M3539_02080 [Acidobacteriota bacterium]|nr:hypothetical protein [Acidobacteriota bacterium]
MNYFNYFTEIEDAFIRRRGKHLLLSPMDWALIESWKEMDLPLHIALRGIEKAFDSWESKPRTRTVKSLLYCQEEVEAQYAEWRQARVGAAADEPDQRVSEALPFSKTAILEYLKQGRTKLVAARNHRMTTVEDDLADAIRRSVALLSEVEQDVKQTTSVDAQKLEQSLTGLERMLSDAARSAVEPQKLEALEREVKEQLKPYRKQMQPPVYQQTLDNLLLKRLREHFGIPRLSLFYL